jgi:CelD/BcsL family acetyltransferase involved in cellulose biosynthesis
MYDIKDLSFEEACTDYESQWIEIVKANLLNPSLLPGWLRCTFSAFDIASKVKVTVFFDKNQPVAFIPYYYTQISILGLKLKALNLGANNYCYHQSLICSENHEAILETFLQHQAKVNRWDVFQAGVVEKNTSTDQAILSFAVQQKFSIFQFNGEQSPYLSLSTSWKELLATKARKFRYKVNKREKLLNDGNDYTIKWFNSPESCQELLKIIFDIEEKSWKTSANMDITNNPVEQGLYKVLLDFLAREEILLCNVLYYKDKAVAYNLCYQWVGKVGQIKTSFDNAFKEESPGAILIEYSLQYLIKNNFDEFDFLGDMMPHKSSWTKVTRDHTSYYVYSKTPKARIAVVLKKLISKIKQLKPQNNGKAAKDD